MCLVTLVFELSYVKIRQRLWLVDEDEKNLKRRSISPISPEALAEPVFTTIWFEGISPGRNQIFHTNNPFILWNVNQQSPIITAHSAQNSSNNLLSHPQRIIRYVCWREGVQELTRSSSCTVVERDLAFTDNESFAIVDYQSQCLLSVYLPSRLYSFSYALFASITMHNIHPAN